LSQICKTYKRNQKTEKEKEKEEIKIEKRAPGTTFGPASEASRGPVSNPEPIPLDPSPPH
jgi:hypothetical protein